MSGWTQEVSSLSPGDLPPYSTWSFFAARLVDFFVKHRKNEPMKARELIEDEITPKSIETFKETIVIRWC